MSYYPDTHHRRSTRLAGYNYEDSGAYFITICTQGRRCLFPFPHYGPSPDHASTMLEYWYRALEEHFSAILCDAFVVMPNHVHFIVLILDKHTTGSLSTIVQWFKTMTTNGYISGVRQYGWLPFRGKLWQRNYYDRIIRNENELNQAREYIKANPDNWHRDVNNPSMLR